MGQGASKVGQNGQAASFLRCSAHKPHCAAQAKQGKMDEPSAGQASTLARNEAVADRWLEELERLEEALCESILFQGLDFLKPRRARAGEAGQDG